jgi:hypothetical protein
MSNKNTKVTFQIYKDRAMVVPLHFLLIQIRKFYLKLLPTERTEEYGVDSYSGGTRFES